MAAPSLHGGTPRRGGNRQHAQFGSSAFETVSAPGILRLLAYRRLKSMGSDNETLGVILITEEVDRRDIYNEQLG